MLQTADISLTLLNVGQARHFGDWNWQDVRSPFVRIYYVTEGSAQVVLPDTILNLLPGKLYLIPPYVTHHCVCSGLFVHYYIHLYEQYELTQQGVFDVLEMPYEIEAWPYDSLLFERLCELMPHQALQASNPDTYDDHDTLMETLRESRHRPLGVRVEAKGIMQILLSRFICQSQRRQMVQDNRIAKALEYINSHLNTKISLDVLSTEACLSKDHFIRLFKQTIGETPGSYVNRKKLEQAELMLVTTNEPITNIASMLAFEDTSYFVRLFRQHIGMAPQQYRNSSK
ncbi:MAG: helix-turn-helix transcriptional regulator [Prevotella sp.]|nr:helix-turn-helix transcriptional regulator [Prevotella sp.]